MKLGWYLAALRRYATFSGRASRTEFWSFVLGATLVCILAAAVEASLLPRTGRRDAVVVWFVALAHVVPAYAVTVRRLHDAGHTGWLALLNAVPFGSLVVLVLACLPSTPWPNPYGPPPNEGTSAASATGNGRATQPGYVDPTADGFDFLAGGYPQQPSPVADALATPARPAQAAAGAPVEASSSQQAITRPLLPAGDLIGELERLARLKADGMLNDGEFAQLKARLLDIAPAA